MPLPDIKPQYEDVEIDGVGTIRLRPLTLRERKTFAAWDPEDGDMFDAMIYLLTAAIDEEPDYVKEWVLDGDERAVTVYETVIERMKTGLEEEALGN